MVILLSYLCWIVQNKQGEKQANDVQGTLSKYQIVDQTIEIEEEIVPVIVRPGHIRFEPIGMVQILVPHVSSLLECFKP